MSGSVEAHFGVVVLTMGQRPADLRRALDSVLAQQGVTTDIVVVGNGWVPVDLPDGVRAHGLP
ncbi:MAG: glycosyltransferase family 2 protein, partial [Actinomycetota bacterium]|nr:glycosyltransferase family 2 protein [Actinomycetota bacterium]